MINNYFEALIKTFSSKNNTKPQAALEYVVNTVQQNHEKSNGHLVGFKARAEQKKLFRNAFMHQTILASLLIYYAYI